MIAYLDYSVVLRLLLGEPDRLAEFGRITRGVSSLLLKLECLRTIDRLRLSGRVPAYYAKVKLTPVAAGEDPGRPGGVCRQDRSAQEATRGPNQGAGRQER